jgi:predicted amidophosphoribosyltransferase
LALAAAHAVDLVGAPQPVILVPVPIRRRDRWRRGGDPVAAIARQAASRLRAAGCPTEMGGWLRWCRPAVDQVGLSAADRQRNVAGAFRLAASSTGPGSVLLVDDLVTTGATAAAAGDALTRGGHRPVAIACIAHPGGGLLTGAADVHLR